MVGLAAAGILCVLPVDRPVLRSIGRCTSCQNRPELAEVRNAGIARMAGGLIGVLVGPRQIMRNVALHRLDQPVVEIGRVGIVLQEIR